MIHLHDVHKSYERGRTVTPVLQGINLRVSSGECVFLMGPSGSGKSTLLSILGCILTPDRGEVQILGRDLTRLSARKRAVLRRHHIGFVFQRFHLIRGLNAVENVQLPLTLAEHRGRVSRRRAADLLDAVGLSDHLKSDPRNMSAGQCQRIALARALAANPDLLLADEPTASLDGSNGQEVMHLLRALTRQSNKTAVVVTHDHRILPFADRVFHIENGRVSQEQSVTVAETVAGGAG